MPNRRKIYRANICIGSTMAYQQLREKSATKYLSETISEDHVALA